MEIIKYEKIGKDKYKLYLSNNQKFVLSDKIILDNKLLYKKEIDSDTLTKLLEENNYYEIYEMCLKYSMIRLRCQKEIYQYLQRKKISKDIQEKIISDLIKNKILDDEQYTKAYIHDKLLFTSNGPYKIKLELKNNNIKDEIIDKYINTIDNQIITDKINKEIKKVLKDQSMDNLLKNKIYHKLLSKGYNSIDILNELNKY